MVCCRIHLALPAFLSATRSTSAYVTKTKIPAHILPATSSSRGQRFVHHQGATTTVRKPVSTASSSMTAENEFTSSLYDWEGQWSKGVGRGDMWDTGVASPALQDLLAKGVKATVVGRHDATASGRTLKVVQDTGSVRYCFASKFTLQKAVRYMRKHWTRRILCTISHFRGSVT